MAKRIVESAASGEDELLVSFGHSLAPHPDALELVATRRARLTAPVHTQTIPALVLALHAARKFTTAAGHATEITRKGLLLYGVIPVPNSDNLLLVSPVA